MRKVEQISFGLVRSTEPLVTAMVADLSRNATGRASTKGDLFYGWRLDENRT